MILLIYKGFLEARRLVCYLFHLSIQCMNWKTFFIIIWTMFFNSGTKIVASLFYRISLLLYSSIHPGHRISLTKMTMLYICLSCTKIIYGNDSRIFKGDLLFNQQEGTWDLHCLKKHQVNKSTFLMQVFSISWMIIRVTGWQYLWW